LRDGLDIKLHRVYLHELADAVEEAGQKFGDLEVVFVGDDENGQFVQTYIDLAVCIVTQPDGTQRQVFALMPSPAGKTPGSRTLMQ
jgi:hypothetical protein